MSEILTVSKKDQEVSKMGLGSRFYKLRYKTVLKNS